MSSINTLLEIPILSALSKEELTALAPLLKEKTFRKNNHIISKDEDSKSLMFLAQGKAKVTISSAEGKEVILAYLRRGEFFGELALLTGEDRSADVVALNDCLVLFLSAEDFKRHAANFQGLNFAVMKELAKRLRAATSKIADLALYDVYKRVENALESLAEKRFVNGEDRLVVNERPKHQDLASMIGTSREMVTRALKSLEDDGAIVVEGKRIIIL